MPSLLSYAPNLIAALGLGVLTTLVLLAAIIFHGSTPRERPEILRTLPEIFRAIGEIVRAFGEVIHGPWSRRRRR